MISVFLGAGRELELRGHTSHIGGAAPQHRIALLAHKPRPSPDDASGGADCSALNFIIAARFFKISFAILKFRVAKIVKFQLHYKSALYFAKIPIKF